jgi:hypothetical protein
MGAPFIGTHNILDDFLTLLQGDFGTPFSAFEISFGSTFVRNFGTAFFTRGKI